MQPLRDPTSTVLGGSLRYFIVSRVVNSTVLCYVEQYPEGKGGGGGQFPSCPNGVWNLVIRRGCTLIKWNI